MIPPFVPKGCQDLKTNSTQCHTLNTPVFRFLRKSVISHDKSSYIETREQPRFCITRDCDEGGTMRTRYLLLAALFLFTGNLAESKPIAVQVMYARSRTNLRYGIRDFYSISRTGYRFMGTDRSTVYLSALGLEAYTEGAFVVRNPTNQQATAFQYCIDQAILNRTIITITVDDSLIQNKRIPNLLERMIRHRGGSLLIDLSPESTISCDH